MDVFRVSRLRSVEALRTKKEPYLYVPLRPKVGLY